MTRNEQIVRAAQAGATPAELASIYGVQPPAICKVLRRHGIHLSTPRGSPAAKAPVRERRTMAEKREQAPAPVDRDPCPRCGVRGDIGCSHRRVA